RARERQVEAAVAERPDDGARRPRAELHAALRAVRNQLVEREALRDAVHRADEVLDHPDGLGMVDVETRELSVADDVDAGLLLDADHYPRGVGECLLGRVRHEPVGNGIGAYDGGPDSGHVCDRLLTIW